MEIIFTKNFKKNYRLRVKNNSRKDMLFKDATRLLIKDSNSHLLQIHSLTGSMHGLYALSVMDDLRVVFRITSNFYEFIDIGSHDEVYHP